MNYTVDYVDEPLKEELKKESGINHISDKKLGYRELNEAIVLPARYFGWRSGGGIITEKGYEEGSANRGSREFGFPYEYSENDIAFSDETVVYIGMFEKVWGHVITDNLSLIWFLKSEYFQKYKDSKIIYIAPTEELSANFVELLSYADVDVKRLVKITAATKFKKIILPDRSFFSVGETKYATEEYRSTINDIVSKVVELSDKKYDKVYFTRSKFSSDDVGEKKLEKYFLKHGYTIISPEKYTFAEQLAILRSCSHFAATEGSISHNSVFLKPHTNVIIINRANYLAPYSFALFAVNSVEATYISAHLSILVRRTYRNNGPNFYYQSENLFKFFGEKYPDDNPRYWIYNFKDFKKYLAEYCFLEDREVRIPDDYMYVKAGKCITQYCFMRKKAFPYCFLRIKYLPKRIQKYFKRKKENE